MRNTFNEARRKDGLTGENLVELLEMRLDALVLRAGFARTTAQGEAIEIEPLAKMQAENGVIVHKWNDTMMNAFRTAWDEVVAEKTANSEEFKRVWDHIQAFRAEYAQWKDLGYVD